MACCDYPTQGASFLTEPPGGSEATLCKAREGDTLLRIEPLGFFVQPSYRSCHPAKSPSLVAVIRRFPPGLMCSTLRCFGLVLQPPRAEYKVHRSTSASGDRGREVRRQTVLLTIFLFGCYALAILSDSVIAQEP